MTFTPELGQLAFDVATFEHACPRFIEAGLMCLANEIERVEWNRRQERYCAPVENNGEEYVTEAFEMRAYCWDEDSQRSALPNFRCGDLEVRWYKYVGRGMSMNRPIDANAFFVLIDRCVESVLARTEKP